MSWLIIGAIVAVWQLVIVATMVWFRRMKAYHDRAFTEQEKRLKSASGWPVRSGASRRPRRA
jgi:hypothetical protein